MSTQQSAAALVIPPVPPEILRIKRVLDASREKIAGVCREHISPEDLLRVAMATVYRTPQLQKCDPWSIANALLHAGSCGLHADGEEGFLVPFYNGKSKTYEAKFMPSYRGRIKVVIDSGAARSIDAHVVYANDDFEYHYGIEPYIHHKPALKDRGEPVAVYCAGRNATGEPFLDVLTACRDCLKPCKTCKGKGRIWTDRTPKDCEACGATGSTTKPACDVEKARNASQTPHEGPWIEWWEEKARITAINRMTKRLKGNPRVTALREIDEPGPAVDLPKELDFQSRPMPRRLPAAPESQATAAPEQASDAWLDAQTEFLDLCREAGKSQKYVDDALELAKSQPDPAAALRANLSVLNEEVKGKQMREPGEEG